MSGSSSPICETTAKQLSIDSSQPDLLLRIISEFESKNNILMENNSLLRFKIDSLEYQLKNKKHEINELNKKFVKIMPSIIPDKQHISDDVSVGNSEDSHATIPSAVTNAPSLNVDKSVTGSSTATPINIKYPPQKITYSQVTQAIRSARQLNGRDGLSEAVPAEKNSDSEWKFVKNKNRKPRKTLVVGTYSGAADVEGLDKFKAFHVSNLKPDTSVENLQNFLKNKFSNVIYLSKAFDCLNQPLLLEKIEAYGIRGTALRWFESYLDNRKQRVKVMKNGKTTKSDIKTNYTGVPQGSILGPILFILFTNDMERALMSDSSLLTNYADDTNLLVAGSTYPNLINEASTSYKKIENWIERNGLILSQEKTTTVLFRTKQQKITTPSQIQLSNLSITPEHCTKFLVTVRGTKVLLSSRKAASRPVEVKLEKKIELLGQVCDVKNRNRVRRKRRTEL
ncbi:uncharacterized protein LOC123680915 [Harmonia axyridis]|uniref:uncharacterized protein LOC123680915 n=1 Tax=Harmonia axyridis TaxID=115357 RepID=UPI001E277F5C|nr:uncharacterized protein LOC123680915 [Harmonia axyridis]